MFVGASLLAKGIREQARSYIRKPANGLFGLKEGLGEISATLKSQRKSSLIKVSTKHGVPAKSPPHEN